MPQVSIKSIERIRIADATGSIDRMVALIIVDGIETVFNALYDPPTDTPPITETEIDCYNRNLEAFMIAIQEEIG